VAAKAGPRRDVLLAMNGKLATFCVPVLAAVALLYHVLADLQVAVTQDATLLVIGMTLGLAAAAGLLAAFGPPVLRVGVLAVTAVVFLDVAVRLSGVFDRLTPGIRVFVARDEQRIAHLHQIKAALDKYVSDVGPLPTPEQYGEATGVPDFWLNWWDVSAHDGDGDHLPFLDFLVDDGILPIVPLDPVNEPSSKGDPTGGKQYVYFVVPPDHDYAGGACDPRPDRWTYLLGITDLEYETDRPPAKFSGSGCACLWRDQPNFFQHHFDYILCGSFDSTPEARARAKNVRAERAAAAEAAERATLTRLHGPQDGRRVADVLRIQEALHTYLERVGPLPTPAEYGEGEASRGPGFWQHWWDVSAEDADGDGLPFLDFLVDSGTMTSVPVDPESQAAADGDPRGGRQYVYFVVPPDYTSYQGGSCAASRNRWVYLLGITDLRSEISRPPRNFAGSGCECLWRDSPNFFQEHFDYIVCGTFRR
jgi:hypothetical protein